WSMVTATLAGLVLNWSAPLLVLVLAALLATNVGPVATWAKWLLIILGGLTGVAMLAYCWLMRRGPKPTRVGVKLFAFLLAVPPPIGVLWALYLGHRAVEDSFSALPQAIAEHWKLSSIVAAVVAAGPAIIRFIPVLKTPAVRKIVLKVLLYLAGLVVPLRALALFYAFWHLRGLELGEVNLLGSRLPISQVVLLGIAALSAVVAIFLLNINLTGPHRLYRDQLAATFVQKDETGDASIPLAQVNPKNSGPYHLI